MVFYGTFDAIVQVSAICIFFPQETARFETHIYEHYIWILNRFETISQRNVNARDALKVLTVLQAMVKKVLSQHREENARTNCSYTGTDMISPVANLSLDQALAFNLAEYEKEARSLSLQEGSRSNSQSGEVELSLTCGETIPRREQRQAHEQEHTSFNFAPISPTYDLIFRSVSAAPQTVGMDANTTCAPDSLAQSGDEMNFAQWSFVGDFADDEIWSQLNQI